MNWSLLAELSNAVGLPGAEADIREIVMREISKLTNEIKTDAMGNIIAHLPGEGPILMLDAHMDEVGFMVSNIDEHGFLRVVSLGGIDPRVFYAQRVVIFGKEKLTGVVGAVPPHLTRADPSQRDKVIPIEDCFIDTGLSAEKVKSIIGIGDLVTFDSKCIETDESFIGKAFDDRAGIFAMLEGVKAAVSQKCDLYIVGAVQEEGGIRGIGPAAFDVKPELAISVEGTIANDIPDAQSHRRLAAQGKGAEIRLSDGRFIADRQWSFFIAKIAKEHGIPHQMVVKKVGGTNASVIQTTAAGAKATSVSMAIRYLHSPYGIIQKCDIEATMALVAAIIEDANKFGKN